VKRNKFRFRACASGYTEEGNASWYGVPFHGRHASNGEIYDMYNSPRRTARCHLKPWFASQPEQWQVHGCAHHRPRPFVDNRIIDLSLAAAREVDSIGPGVVPVRVEVLAASIPRPVFSPCRLVLSATCQRRASPERLSASYSPIFIQQYDSPDGVFYRVRVGRISGEDAAHQFGGQLHDREGFTPLVTRLDEGSPAGGNR